MMRKHYYFLFTLFWMLPFLGKSQDLPADVDKEYLNRKLPEIAFFYKHISVDVIKAAVSTNIPPAAILAIIGFESRYGKNYISKITGNITGVRAVERENMMPPVKLPSLRYNYNVFLNVKEISNYKKNEVKWVQYPPTYLRDYRPIPIRGTTLKLDYFKYRPFLEKKARIQSVLDFGNIALSRNSEYKAMKETREWLDDLVAKNGKQIIFEPAVTYAFIDKISGKQNKDTYSEFYRPDWSKRVKQLVDKTGFISFSKDLYYKRYTFEEAWGIIFCCTY